jgi:EpsI family protein
MIHGAWSWVPAAMLSAGAVLTLGSVKQQESVPLRAPLERVVPATMVGLSSSDYTIPEDERRVAGMDNYVMRLFMPAGAPESAALFSVYVGYYMRQFQGHTIHSPKNCLPGGGWEPLVSGTQEITTASGPVSVNRYLIGNGKSRAVVFYWYQGRGRVQANEYRVKWDLLRDQALQGRSDEALVRIMIPVTTSEADADAMAVKVAETLVPSVYRALPS